MPDKLVFFDDCTLYGHNLGIIQVELSTNVFNTTDDGAEVVPEITGRLRCPPAAARALISALQDALEMQGNAAQSSERPKPN